MDDDRSSTTQSRREMLRKAVYVAPAILTLAASPAFAQRGSYAPVRSHPPHPHGGPPGLDRAPGQNRAPGPKGAAKRSW
jgi:hypothetical protein